MKSSHPAEKSYFSYLPQIGMYVLALAAIIVFLMRVRQGGQIKQLSTAELTNVLASP